jgi:hypothetical protein
LAIGSAEEVADGLGIQPAGDLFHRCDRESVACCGAEAAESPLQRLKAFYQWGGRYLIFINGEAAVEFSRRPEPDPNQPAVVMAGSGETLTHGR